MRHELFSCENIQSTFKKWEVEYENLCSFAPPLSNRKQTHKENKSLEESRKSSFLHQNWVTKVFCAAIA